MRTSVASPLKWGLWIALYASAVLAISCGGDDNTTSDGDPLPCTPGSLGCECATGDTCPFGRDLLCESGVCVENPCEVGDEGCACFGNNTCSPTGNGTAQICEAGVCVAQECPEGTLSCACVDGTCLGGLACTDGQCVEAGCPAGEEGCACEMDRGCDGVTIACTGSTCEDVGCIVGSEDCYCDADNACEAGLACDADSLRCEVIDSCTPGAFGCPCDEGSCMGELICDTDDTCQDATCERGSEGCGCLDGDACGMTSSGNPLSCELGVCTATCVAGDPGCACAAGDSCESGYACTGGVCVLDGCDPGTENCSCAGGGCDPGLRCDSGVICVDGTGYVGGDCYDNGLCERGAMCMDEVCVPCFLGSQGCACSDDTCNTGLTCQAGTCMSSTGLAQSLRDIGCFTPCSSGLVLDDGTYQSCNSDGLMEGCYGDTTCVEGQCVTDADNLRDCVFDSECPDFQACMFGSCRSNCEFDTDCQTGASCYRNVCRLPCTVDGSECPTDQYCLTEDGDNGYCMPNTDPSGDTTVEEQAAFEVSLPSITLTNTLTVAEFTVTNLSDRPARIRIRKTRHTGWDEAGLPTTVELDPFGDCEPGSTGCVCARGTTCNDGADACDGGFCRPSDCSTGGEHCGCGEDNVCDAGFVCRDNIPLSVSLTESTGMCDSEDAQCVGGDCPLFWLEMGEGAVRERTQDFEIVLRAGETLPVTVEVPSEVPFTRWTGEIEVSHRSYGTQDILLSYSEVPEGRFEGEIYYFANFEDEGIDDWVDSGYTDISAVRNAFIQVWSRFRAGTVPYDWFQAALTATRTESWRSRELQEICGNAVCFPFNNFDGYITYTSDPDNIPVPSGVAQLPLALNTRPLADGESNPCPNGDTHCYTGRIQSDDALQYAGYPSIQMAFQDDPSDCSVVGPAGCIVYMSEFAGEAVIGPRFRGTSDPASCGTGDDFAHASQPWLIPGFLGRAEFDEETATYYTYECQDTTMPFTDGSEESIAANQTLATSNPIPDGQARRRHIEFIDGALINTDTMFVIFRERTESFLTDDPDDDLMAYGYILLTRENALLEDDDYVGSTPPSMVDAPSELEPAFCSTELLAEIGVPTNALDGLRPDLYADDIASAVVEGVVGDPASLTPIGSGENVHYFCEDTGYIDGGPDDDGRANGVAVSCPAGSRVDYFTVSGITQAEIADLPCQENGTCQGTINLWRENGAYSFREDPLWRCTDPDRVYCSDNRYDLREGKTFFAAGELDAVYLPLRVEIDDAFRYRTRFQNRSGSTVGFVPQLCVEDSDAVPYCYDPWMIELAAERVDCALELYTQYYDDMSSDSRLLLLEYLTENFAFNEEIDIATNTSTITYGFEHLNAELLIMLGDDAYQNALASRFDLAGVSSGSFQGSLFEPNGIDLSGVAGFEMQSLYRAVQYYQMSLDRFFDLSGMIAESIAVDEAGGQETFIGRDTVVSYFDRLIRASTQKSRTLSQIATRYQNLNRPDLARAVIERGYTSAYMESIILSHMMSEVVSVEGTQDEVQIRALIDTAQRSYRLALAEMRQLYADISDGINFFGFAPDYIPFPTLQGLTDTGFEVSLSRARERMNIAAELERDALSSDRSFETDAASFQNELVSIRNNYEGRLSEICGTMDVEGRVYPAIRKYAYLEEDARLLGDPCGLMGTGAIHNALGDIDIAITNILTVRQQMSNVLEEAAIVERSIEAQCDVIDAFAQLQAETAQETSDVQTEIATTRLIFSELDQVANIATTTAQLANCSVGTSTSCPGAGIGLAAYVTVMAGIEIARTIAEADIISKEEDLRELQSELEVAQTLMQCDMAEIQGLQQVETILLRTTELELEAVRAQYGLDQAVAQLRQLVNEANRIQDEAEEAEELAINIEATRNNPNIRIYRNDAIINADRSFYSAIREAYKATRVYEYYTSTSYAALDQLFLTRMVTRGDYNLQQYLTDLEDAFRDFEDQFGNPDLRVQAISLRNDILQIPYSNAFGESLGETERIEMFRDALVDVNNLDSNGYITIPFNTRLNELSPLTANHKIRYIQAEIIGSDIGDALGRLYLRMAGTSTVSSVSGELLYYRFPERTAVINTYFNGNRIYDQDVYRSSRLVDRPYINSRWELVLNTVDEDVNRDINLDSLTDIRLYIYYSDFTTF